MRRSRPALLVAILFLITPAVLGGVGEQGQTLLPGQIRERPLAGGEAHAYRVEVMDAPLLVVVEQSALDLEVEAARAGAALTVDTGDHGWGSEVLLLESAGEHRIEVRPKDRFVEPGRYTIRVDALPGSSAEDVQRRAALSLMTRAGQEASGRTPTAWRRALPLYRDALATWRSLGERRWEGEVLYTVAVLERDTRELPAAAAAYLQALALWRELGEPNLEATALNGLGSTRSLMGEIEGAREALRSALSLWQRLGERFEEGETRGNLCYLELRSGVLSAARPCYEETRALYRELGSRRQEARTLNNLGGVYDGLGEPDAALEHYEQALALRRSLADRLGEAETLNNIAVIHRALGEWQEALRVYDQVREILAPLGDRSLEAARLNNVGFAYNNLGEPQRALPFLGDALKLRRETGDRGGEILTLNNIGDAWRKLGDVEKGLAHHRQALEIAKALGDRRQEALTRLRLAEVQIEQGDPSAALRELDPAVASLNEMGLRQREAQALHLRGRALALAGRPREALPVFRDVLARRRALRDRAGEAEALQALAAAERSLDLRQEARGHADEAVARVEELRTGFVSPNLRAAFLATQRRAYSLVIDLLMDRHAAAPGAGHDREAFEISERARARSLLDVLRSGNTVRAGSAAPAALLERRPALRRRLSSMAYQQLQQSGAKAEALGREMEKLLAELDGVEAEIRRLDSRYAAVAAPPTLGVEEIAKLLDPGTLLLEYSLGEDRSYLWAVGAGSFRSFVLPPQREIEALARQLYEELSTLEAGTGRRTEAAEALSRILLDPVWPEAARGHRLVVVPDAALHILPFGALPVPGSGGRLLDQLEVAYVPSATTLALQRQRLEHRPPAAKWAAVLADPVFTADDPRLADPSVAGQGRQPAAPLGTERDAPEEAPLAALERLPATRREAETIADLAPAGQVWIALNLDASREAVLAGGLRGYRVVHFATHGLADTRNPELSGLVLSLVDAAGRPREGFLGLSDIYELDLDAGLVVLSGCRTALGKEVRGEGIMGLTRGFLYAGAPRVVASLWKVQDRTTAELMDRFYRALWRDRLPAAAALREAQRWLRRDPRYRDPYSWAGFVLQGDWR
jgi:CHAT domain-containing protein/tetratricopeptide (TPR) repeat protein